MKRRYEKTIISHSGIREIESEIFEGYDPNNKRVWSKLAVDRDLAPSESNLNLNFVLNSNGILTQDRKPKKNPVEIPNLETAKEMQRSMGGPEKCEILESNGGVKIRPKAGAVSRSRLMVGNLCVTRFFKHETD